MISKPIQGTQFWNELNPEITNGGGVGHFNDGDLQYAAMNASVKMRTIVRTREELFEDTIDRENGRFKVAINGNWYGLDLAGKMDALSGHDPVEATHTSPEGQVISNGRIVTGTPEPDKFYVAYSDIVEGASNPADSYRFGFGNPPGTSLAAMGGLGPVIIGKLKYGTRNLYRSGCPSGAPATGQPGSAYAGYLIQRSNFTYTSFLGLGQTTGKIAVALCRSAQKILVLVQPNGSSNGITLDTLRDKLAGVGVDDAVFLDGSDSVMLVINGTWHIRPGENKSETNTTGLGFFHTYTVTYNGNGISSRAVPTDGNNYEQGDLVTVRGNAEALSRLMSGSTFAGWNTVANGSGKRYTIGDTFTMGASNLTLFAQWKSD